jgi:hypothetical protein
VGPTAYGRRSKSGETPDRAADLRAGRAARKRTGASGHRLRAIARHEWAGTVRKKDQIETSRISQIAQVPSLLQEPLDR